MKILFENKTQKKIWLMSWKTIADMTTALTDLDLDKDEGKRREQIKEWAEQKSLTGSPGTKLIAGRSGWLDGKYFMYSFSHGSDCYYYTIDDGVKSVAITQSNATSSIKFSGVKIGEDMSITPKKVVKDAV